MAKKDFHFAKACPRKNEQRKKTFTKKHKSTENCSSFF